MINIQEDLTFEKFGYCSNQLALYSHKFIISKCIMCGILKESEKRQTTEFCPSCARKISRPKTLYYCIDCNKPISRNAEQCKSCAQIGKKRPKQSEKIKGENNSFFGKKHTEESKQKISEKAKIRLKDPRNHPNFRPNISRIYPIIWTPQLRKKIRNRDNHECQYCYKSEDELNRVLCVHHIDYDKQNCNETNLISLCLDCHLHTQTNRNYWYVYFTYYLESLEIINANESN